MNYKIALIFGIILFILVTLDARKNEPRCSNCKYLSWRRPLKRIIKRQDLRRHHFRQQQAARIQKYIAKRKPKAVPPPKDDLKSTLKSNMKMIQDAFLSNLRENNGKTYAKPSVRSRREESVIEITRRHKFKRPWIKIRERLSNKIYKDAPPPKPTLPPPTEPPNEALLLVKNLHDLTTNARNLARKGFEALYKALDD